MCKEYFDNIPFGESFGVCGWSITYYSKTKFEILGKIMRLSVGDGQETILQKCL